MQSKANLAAAHWPATSGAMNATASGRRFDGRASTGKSETRGGRIALSGATAAAAFGSVEARK
jgi:hypothetical protein